MSDDNDQMKPGLSDEQVDGLARSILMQYLNLGVRVIDCTRIARQIETVARGSTDWSIPSTDNITKLALVESGFYDEEGNLNPEYAEQEKE
jgi:hypothetical protein